MQLFYLLTSAFMLNSIYRQLSFPIAALCHEHMLETKTDVVSGEGSDCTSSKLPKSFQMSHCTEK